MVRGLVLLLALWLAGCVAPRPAAELVLGDATFTRDQTWSGQVRIRGKVRLVNGASLTLLPGTEVRFERIDADRDGLGDAAIEIERGDLVAVGTPLAPIRLRSAADRPRPGDWLELKVDFSRRIELRWCEIRDSAHGLHAHFSRGEVADSVLRDNIDGTRFGQGRYTVRNSLVLHNSGKGINFRNSQVILDGNLFIGNHAGLFIFETDRPLTVAGNNFLGNDTHVRLGDFFSGEIHLGRNWFSGGDELDRLLHDRGEDPASGLLSAEAAPTWQVPAGPDPRPDIGEDWSLATGGYVDADPVAAEETLFLPGWDGRLRALTADGTVSWTAELGEVADAAVAVDDERVYVQTWGREVLALDRAQGRRLWSFRYPASPHDDHRQGGVARWRDLLLVPAWNGRLYALEAASGREVWSVDCGMPLRSAPLVRKEAIYQAAGSGRLSRIAPDGRLLWSLDLSSPLLSSPVALDTGVAVLTRNGELVAVGDDGRIRWRMPLGEEAFYAAPVAANGLLYVATAAGSLHALDPETGARLWRIDVGAPVYATPRVARGLIFVGDNRGRLQIFNSFDGRRLAVFAAGDAIQSRPLLLQGRLVFGSRDGKIYALRLDFAEQEKLTTGQHS
ncbi:outer membrane protein assembly factor BamB [Geothermobacter ehrlichii]|uniref:Outer membrane protein assembly factor BamB n=1 Tax=Geothermobacter ehrlichii TaxID=213224 RepID=A0A5D3WFF4_9BACT|nr:PQQ-binding-like beta-propeller repeat protein [Geothermobacter ehrlichii]TYO96371.1 outer membrane protein assembly factor BamB [Geothermobacter ehrlichii]